MAKKLTAERPNVPDDVIVSCLAEYTEEMGTMRRIQQRIGTILKRWENQGVNTKEVKHTYALANMDSREAREAWRTRARYAAIAGIIPVEWATNGQGDFAKAFEEAPGAIKVEVTGAEGRLACARAFNDGYNSALHGAALDSNPFDHAPGSEVYVRWRDGWQDGSADRAAREALKPPKKAKGETQEKEAQPRKRGRKKKAEGDDIGEVAGRA